MYLIKACVTQRASVRLLAPSLDAVEVVLVVAAPAQASDRVTRGERLEAYATLPRASHRRRCHGGQRVVCLFANFQFTVYAPAFTAASVAAAL